MIHVKREEIAEIQSPQYARQAAEDYLGKFATSALIGTTLITVGQFSHESMGLLSHIPSVLGGVALAHSLPALKTSLLLFHKAGEVRREYGPF